MQKMLSYVRRCVEDYDMIQEGDRIAVGVSGGKDSLALLKTLKALSRFYPKRFELVAITLDMGFPDADFSPVARFCEELAVPYRCVKTDIKAVVFDIRKEENPCSLCAKLRRGALHDAALAEGCPTVALGHHFDDAVETYMLSLFFEGRISCFQPKSFLDRKGITLIRPMLYVPEKKIRSFAKKENLPVAKNPCVADGATKREEIKQLLLTLERQYPDLREHIFGAMQRYPIRGWERLPRERPRREKKPGPAEA